MRLRIPKDPLFTIQVFHRLKEQHSNYNIKLVIIGDGPLRGDCEKLIEELGLNRDVYLLGTRPDARELLNDMDVVHYFPNGRAYPVILEAMFGGNPLLLPL